MTTMADVIVAAGVLLFFGMFWILVESQNRQRRRRRAYRRQPGRARERYVIKDDIVYHLDPPHISVRTVEVDLKARDLPRNWILPKYWEDT